MYWNVSLALKWVLMSRTDSLLNLSPLQKVASETNISVVNFQELIDDISVCVRERDYVVHVAFPNERLYQGFAFYP